LVRDMRVLDAKDHCHFSPKLGKEINCVIGVGGGRRGRVGCCIRAKGAGMDVGGEVGYASGYTSVKLGGI
jgi:hypothetical protein